jgi:hypothetical protein
MGAKQNNREINMDTKPCPFCGQIPSVWTFEGREVVECKNDSCPLYYEYTGSIFLDIWNTRPVEDEKDKIIAALREK